MVVLNRTCAGVEHGSFQAAGDSLDARSPVEVGEAGRRNSDLEKERRPAFGMLLDLHVVR